MQHVIPALRITDYDESLDFYVRRLGFNIDWEHRFDAGYPVFMQISKFGIQIYLSEHAGDCSVGGLVYFYVPDVDVWYEHCVNSGIVANYIPVNQEWGNRDFRITDPDGNKICIATRTPVGSEDRAKK
jgi:catechol 2,3-dioxygenase-like lactoylglutathione lyase family enzyme